MANKKKKSRITLGGNESKNQEIPVPLEVMERIFDESGGIWYENEEEREYRIQKEEYNKALISKIRRLNFTERQKQIFLLMFKKGLTLTETARFLKEPITTIQVIKDGIVKRIKEEIDYDFYFVNDRKNLDK